MTRFAVDTSVLIAAAVSAHPRHSDAIGELESRLDAGDRMLLPGHVLAELYAVLTRLPSPGRFSPAAACDALQSFVDAAESLIALGGESYLGLIRWAADRGIAGGRIYDALILETARLADAEIILTFNTRHFAGLVPGLEVREPGSG